MILPDQNENSSLIDKNRLTVCAFIVEEALRGKRVLVSARH
jgi:hypothetical protein